MMYERINECLVMIRGDQKPEPSFITGVTVVAEDNFCCIMALKEALCPDGEANLIYEVFFPNNESMELQMEDIAAVDEGNLVLFAFVTPKRYVNAVTFSNQEVTDHEKIYLAGFHSDQVPYHLTNGVVTRADPNDSYFSHECSSFLFTALGEPIFNSRGHLVGITFLDHGVFRAYKLRAIRQYLSWFSNQMTRDEYSPWLELHQIRVFIVGMLQNWRVLISHVP